MFLDVWMLIVLALVFGICAVWNRKQGQGEGAYIGATALLEKLVDLGVITIEENGTIHGKNNIQKIDQPNC